MDSAFIVSEKDYEVGIPAILVNDIKQAMSLIAMEFYGHPEKQLKLISLHRDQGKDNIGLLCIPYFGTKSPTSYAVDYEYDAGW